MCSLTLSTAKTTEATEAATTSKDITEHREDVVHREATTAKATEATHTLRTVEAKLIILLTFLRIVQHIISLGSLLEFLLGFLITRVTVGVIFDGYLSIGLLDIILRGVFIHP